MKITSKLYYLPSGRPKEYFDGTQEMIVLWDDRDIAEESSLTRDGFDRSQVSIRVSLEPPGSVVFEVYTTEDLDRRVSFGGDTVSGTLREAIVDYVREWIWDLEEPLGEVLVGKELVELWPEDIV